MKFRTLLQILLLFAIEVNTSANVLIVYDQGNSPLPLSGDLSEANISSLKLSATQELDISMDEETVRISEADSGEFLVTCSFTMQSHSDKKLTRLIGFPVINSSYENHMEKSFKVKIDDISVPTKVIMMRESTGEERLFGLHDHEGLNYPGYVVWPVVWKPKQTIKITCTYDAGYAGGFEAFGYIFQLQYIVRTGALWKGPIGKARISVKFRQSFLNDNPEIKKNKNGSEKYKLLISYPENAELISSDEIVWNFKDWEPYKDIFINQGQWLGFYNEYFFRLPLPYKGDRIKYTDEMLDSLIEREVAPWRDMFSYEVEKMNKMPLKKYIAAWLYNEIAARHGDAFILGKVGDGPKPKATYYEDDKFYYSKWRAFFDPYRKYGRWYYPNENKTITDKFLNENERANRAFLKKQYLKEGE